MEYNLTDCETGTGTRQSSHDEDVGVKCNTSKLSKYFMSFPSRRGLDGFQLMKIIAMVTFVWWEDLTTGRVEWRYSGMEHGELSVMLTGVCQKLRLCVNNFNYLWKVSQNVKTKLICQCEFSRFSAIPLWSRQWCH